jgi:transposase
LTKFIQVIKLFILEIPVNKLIRLIKSFIWLTILPTRWTTGLGRCMFKFGSEDDEFLSGEVEMDESYFGGRRKVKRGEGSKG